MRISVQEALKRGWLDPEQAQDLRQPAKRGGRPPGKPAAKPNAVTPTPSPGITSLAQVEAILACVPSVVKPGIKQKDIEGLEQAQLVELVRLHFPIEGALLIHIPNGGSRKNAYEGWRLKQQGVRSGVSDLFLPVPRNSKHGLWIEFKASPPHTAKIQDSQKEWVSVMTEQGYEAHICIGVAQAFRCIVQYLLALK